MKNKFYLILMLACAMCFTSGLAAQDVDQPEKPKAAKKAKAAKKKKAPLTKYFGGAELTEAQKTQLTELVSTNKEEMLANRRSVSELVSKEDAKTIKTTIRKSIKGGMERAAAQQAAWEQVGLSAESQAKLTQLQKQRAELEQEMVNEVVATFSDEQKATMKAGLEKAKNSTGKTAKKKKGKGKKMKDEMKPEEAS